MAIECVYFLIHTTKVQQAPSFLQSAGMFSAVCLIR